MSIERFRKVYTMLPEVERKFPIVVIDDKPITWEIAFKEISTKTELGRKIQEKLEELKII